MGKTSKNNETAKFGIGVIMPRFKVHYAPYGEWGGERVNCGKYYTTDVAHTGNRDKVTCKFCQRLFK